MTIENEVAMNPVAVIAHCMYHITFFGYSWHRIERLVLNPSILPT